MQHHLTTEPRAQEQGDQNEPLACFTLPDHTRLFVELRAITDATGPGWGVNVALECGPEGVVLGYRREGRWRCRPIPATFTQGRQCVLVPLLALEAALSRFPAPPLEHFTVWCYRRKLLLSCGGQRPLVVPVPLALPKLPTGAPTSIRA